MIKHRKKGFVTTHFPNVYDVLQSICILLLVRPRSCLVTLMGLDSQEGFFIVTNCVDLIRK